jgi:hypothetical protein
MATTVRLMVGKSLAGAPAFEEVVAEYQGMRKYKLLRSPGLALGIAAGDEFELSEDGTYKVLQRGGNICLQIFATAGIAALETDATARLAPLGATLDGKSTKELVYTISVTVGFESIEAALESLLRNHPSAEWYYGNVYDPLDGVTPLGWWTSLSN